MHDYFNIKTQKIARPVSEKKFLIKKKQLLLQKKLLTWKLIRFKLDSESLWLFKKK